MNTTHKAGLCLLALIVSLTSLFAGIALVQAQERQVYVLTTSDWNVPRTTDSILSMPALKNTLQAFDRHSGSRIQILYPGGDEGTLWATELRSWLIALGIASRHIELLPGSRDPDQLELVVIAPTDRVQVKK